MCMFVKCFVTKEVSDFQIYTLYSIMTLQTVRSLYWQFRVFRPKLMIFDFDGTLTSQETISPLIQLAQQHWTKSEFKSFEEHIFWYSTNHRICEQRLLDNLRKYQKEISDGTKKWDINEVAQYFTGCDSLDRESLNKLNQNGNYLRNIKVDELGPIYKEYIRPEAAEQIQEFVDDGCRVKILSLNWSSDAIHDALDGVVPREDIVCNELEYDADRVSTGKLEYRCVTSADKMEFVKQWKSEYLNDDVDLSMYVGDAWGDCLASWTTDLRVWMETDKNAEFLDVVRDISV